MSRPPQEYATFVAVVMVVSLIIGMAVGMLMEHLERPKTCPICADIVREHTKAFRAANRLAHAGRDARSRMQDARDDLDHYEDDDWEDSRAR